MIRSTKTRLSSSSPIGKMEFSVPLFFCIPLSRLDYSGRGKFMPLPLKSKLLETPGSLVTDDIKMFPL
jgi:hypothetical protein